MSDVLAGTSLIDGFSGEQLRPGDAGYDQSRINVGGTFQFVVWFAGSLVAIVVVLWFVRPFLDRNSTANVTLRQPPNGVPPTGDT